MPAVSFKGARCTGHACFPPRHSTSGCAWVVIEGSGDVLRVGDSWAVHRCGKALHDGVQVGGSDLVDIEGVPIARIGDAVNCGSAVAEGADFVFSD